MGKNCILASKFFVKSNRLLFLCLFMLIVLDSFVGIITASFLFFPLLLLFIIVAKFSNKGFVFWMNASLLCLIFCIFSYLVKIRFYSIFQVWFFSFLTIGLIKQIKE